MKRKIINIFLAALFLILFNINLSAQEKTTIRNNEKAGFIFGYKVKDGKSELFEEGYKNHLEWHKNKNDQLVWYAWYVFTGERTGIFIDGSFGSPLKAFDERIDISGDAADFKLTTAPYVEPLFRSILVCKENLSTVFPLEEKKPSKLIHVINFNINNGREKIFESTIEKIISGINKEKIKFTFYKLIDGGETPQYILMIPQYGFADYNSNYSIGEIVSENFDGEESERLLNSINICVKSSRSETWGYRANLSYFPGK